ncbi:MAG: hypothetical protein UZ07_CHB004001174 [Chlorobi bacterium OLB7]|nr:MAG: hypothetical protein UZ07_CHB004001174 [Chlorobi bacterium OLB7]
MPKRQLQESKKMLPSTAMNTDAGQHLLAAANGIYRSNISRRMLRWVGVVSTA